MSSLNVVTIQFKGNSIKRYSYITDLNVTIGGYAVVDSPSSGMVLVDIMDVTPLEDLSKAHKFKWLVDVINLEPYVARKAVEIRKRQITDTLDEMVANSEKIHKYKILEELFPEAKELLSELKNLTAETTGIC